MPDHVHQWRAYTGGWVCVLCGATEPLRAWNMNGVARGALAKLDQTERPK